MFTHFYHDRLVSGCDIIWVSNSSVDAANCITIVLVMGQPTVGWGLMGQLTACTVPDRPIVQPHCFVQMSHLGQVLNGFASRFFSRLLMYILIL